MSAQAHAGVPPLRAVPDPAPEIPPHDDVAERSTLSAVLLDPTAIAKVADFLRPEHFFSRAHALIFEACAALTAAREPIDLTTVSSWLKARAKLGDVGGPGYIAEVADGSPSVTNVRSHAIAVHECWRRRKVIDVCHRTRAVGYHAVPDVQRFCDDAARAIATIGGQNPAAPIESISDALTRVLAEAVGVSVPGMLKPVQALGVPTGIVSLDRLIGGLRRKAKTTIAGEKGGGKTALGLQFALHAAMAGIAVIMFSTELAMEELMRRAVCSLSGVGRDRMKERRLSPHDVDALYAASAKIKDLPIHIDPTARITVEQLRARAEAHAERSMLLHRKPMGLVVVDYVQRLAPSASKAGREEREQIAHATRELKILSQELDVAVLELAQANPPKREGKRVIRTMWGSSVIGKESDDEIFIALDPDCDPRAPVKSMVLDVVKQRDGRLGEIPVRYRGPLFRFEDINAPGQSPSRQYVDPILEPPRGRFDDDETNPLTEGL